jgi:hypothetical protein
MDEYKFEIGDRVRYTSIDQKGKQYTATVVNIVPNYDNPYDIQLDGYGVVAACERELDLLESIRRYQNVNSNS